MTDQNQTSRRRDRAASTRALLDAGIRLFGARGFDGTTTAAIAREAGLNEQLISRYFGSKAGLLAAIHDEHLALVRDHLEGDETPPLPDLESELRRIMHRAHDHIRQSERYLRVMLPRLVVDQDAAERMRIVLPDRSDAWLAARLAGFQQAGQIAPWVDIAALSRTVVEKVFATSFLRIALFAPTEAEIAQEYDSFARMIVRGIALD